MPKELSPESTELLKSRLEDAATRLAKTISLNAPDVIIRSQSKHLFNAIMRLYGDELLELYQLKIRTNEMDGVTWQFLYLSDIFPHFDGDDDPVGLDDGTEPTK